jgi:hypothetical protein
MIFRACCIQISQSARGSAIFHLFDTMYQPLDGIYHHNYLWMSWKAGKVDLDLHVIKWSDSK